MRRALLFCTLISCLGAPLVAQPPASSNARRLQGRAVDATAPTNLQTLLWRCAVPSVAFTGAGLNDATSGGTCTAATAALYEVIISSATASPDEFKWRKDGGSLSAAVPMTGAAQELSDGVTITFKATDGHTLADAWAIATTVSWTPSAISDADAVAGAAALPASAIDYLPKVTAAGILGVSNLYCPLGACKVISPAAGTVPFTVQGFAGQTAHLQDWGTAGYTYVTYDGLGIYSNGFRNTIESSFLDSMNGLRWSSSLGIVWSSNTVYSGPKDLGIHRYGAGVLEVDSSTTGKSAGLRVGTLTAVALATPGVTTVTPTCVPGVCNLTWSYTVEALAGDSTTTIPGAVGSTALQNATINAASYNTVTWAAVTGATKYTVRRTVSAGTPASLGALTTCTGITGLSCVDNGLVGDAGTAPTGNTTGAVVVKLETPAASAATCTAGAIWADTGYIYVCTASGTVERVAVAAW